MAFTRKTLAPDHVDDPPAQVRPPRAATEAVSRHEVLELAERLGWPRCQYGLRQLTDEREWRGAPFPFRSDRRSVWEQLIEIERERRTETRSRKL
jgi:hypothetical protein